MGGCLDPTPEMGPFTVEVRGESFYLGCHSDYLAVTPERGWSIPAGQVPALVAAFDQVRDFHGYAAALQENQEGSALPEHRVEVREGRVHVHGLSYAYLGDASTREWPYRTLEVEYRYVQALQDVITAAAQGTPA
ncbi:hypothetical protein AB0F17_43075 [Nonomuraea sp. NPDC026600]|uniref:hypothetical protein n=1 Tax=Nonomuraea sp. NPDC026600 TaxID=3155363 RepID=UPI0033CAE4A7